MRIWVCLPYIQATDYMWIFFFIIGRSYTVFSVLTNNASVIINRCHRPISQIAECPWSLSHSAQFRTEWDTFLFWMGHCGIWNRCILWFEKKVNFKDVPFGTTTAKFCQFLNSQKTTHVLPSSVNHEASHDDVIKVKHFPRYWPFVRGIHRWIPLTKASDAELLYFLWSVPE